MRKIIFRGKRTDNGEWIKGAVYRLPSERDIVVIEFLDQNDWEWKRYMVNPSTVGQFTGLYDKSGKRIFEGDILSFNSISRPFVVKFADGSFYMDGTAIPIRHADHFCIIGNIHDNPELLEKVE